MSMDTQTKELIQLWNLLELGFELPLRYADKGIINEGEDVVINVTAIAETAEQWNEPIEPKQVSMFEAAGLVAVPVWLMIIWKNLLHTKEVLLIH